MESFNFNPMLFLLIEWNHLSNLVKIINNRAYIASLFYMKLSKNIFHFQSFHLTVY